MQHRWQFSCATLAYKCYMFNIGLLYGIWVVGRVIGTDAERVSDSPSDVLSVPMLSRQPPCLQQRNKLLVDGCRCFGKFQ